MSLPSFHVEHNRAASRHDPDLALSPLPCSLPLPIRVAGEGINQVSPSVCHQRGTSGPCSCPCPCPAPPQQSVPTRPDIRWSLFTDYDRLFHLVSLAQSSPVRFSFPFFSPQICFFSPFSPFFSLSMSFTLFYLSIHKGQICLCPRGPGGGGTTAIPRKKQKEGNNEEHPQGRATKTNKGKGL